MATERKFNLKRCPFCRRSYCFTGVKVHAGPNDEEWWYITCDWDRGGCGATSGWYTSLESIPAEFLIVDELDYGHPIADNPDGIAEVHFDNNSGGS